MIEKIVSLGEDKQGNRYGKANCDLDLAVDAAAAAQDIADAPKWNTCHRRWPIDDGLVATRSPVPLPPNHPGLRAPQDSPTFDSPREIEG